MCEDRSNSQKQTEDKLEVLLEPYFVFLGSANPLSRRNEIIKERKEKDRKKK